ncbi:MAG: hypothetical protein AAFR87_18765, partial [Bacteroidota bacterium]
TKKNLPPCHIPQSFSTKYIETQEMDKEAEHIFLQTLEKGLLHLPDHLHKYDKSERFDPSLFRAFEEIYVQPPYPFPVSLCI